MVSPDEVRTAYRDILGREPESDQVIAERAARHRSAEELQASLVEEYRRTLLYWGSFRGPGNRSSD